MPNASLTTAPLQTNRTKTEQELKQDKALDKFNSILPAALRDIWIMFYRHGMNANLTKCFHCEGAILDARRRAEAHCKIMNYKFIFVRPLVCNLELEEIQKLGAPEGAQFV